MVDTKLGSEEANTWDTRQGEGYKKKTWPA